MGENLWVAVGEWVCQWRRWRFVSLMRIGKFWGKKKKTDENEQSCEERENNNILIK